MREQSRKVAKIMQRRIRAITLQVPIEKSPMLKIINLIVQKRFYTRGTLRSTSIPRLAKILTLYRDWLRALKKEKG